MAMGIISDEELELEIINSIYRKKIPASTNTEAENIPPAIIQDVPKPGRGEGNNQVPDSLRKIIGEEHTINGRSAGIALAESFGISHSSESAYANGATSTTSYDKTPNKNHINDAKTRVVKKARNKLFAALNNITNDKLENTKARELAGIAKDMSAVIKNMEPDSPVGKESNGPTFVFFAPLPIREDKFDVIEVTD